MGDAKVEVKWNAKGDSERVRRRFASPFSTSFASPFTTFASPFKPPSHFLAMRSKLTVQKSFFSCLSNVGYFLNKRHKHET